MNVELETYSVPLGRGGKYGSLAVDLGALPMVSRVHIVEYGIRQILNDAIADKTDDDGAALSDAEIVAKATKRLATLESGELRAIRASAEPVDPVERVLHKLARDGVAALLKRTDEYKAIEPKKGQDRVLAALVARNGDGMTWALAIDKYIAANPKLRAEAKRLVDAGNAAVAAVEL